MTSDSTAKPKGSNRVKLLVGAFFVVSFVAAFGLMIRTSLNSAGQFLGEDLPLTTLKPDQEPEAITVAELLRRKKLTVINFWASWCPPCLQEAPFLKQLKASQKARASGIQFIAIASSDDRFAALSSKKYGLSDYQPYFDDNDSQVSRANHVTQLPQTFLVDDTGKVLIRLKGMMTAQRLRAWQKAIGYRLPASAKPTPSSPNR